MSVTRQQPVSKFLVVCGATNAASDSWHFSNFLGFYRALRILGVEGGDFWSCFPIREYFDEGHHHDSIKFGRRGRDGQNSLKEQEAMIEIFNRAQFYSGERFFWDQISGDRVDQLADEVLRYMEIQDKKLVAGDIFNIILIGHGTEEGTSIGGKILQAKDLAEVLDTFRPGVRVNVVVQSCDSGIFMDKISAKKERQRFIHTFISCEDLSWAAQISPSGRFPHSVFSGAFLRSLGLVGSAETTDWTLEEHINFLKLNTSDIALIVRFLDVLFTDFVDQSFSQTPTATNLARRIITPSTTVTRPGLPQHNIPWQHVQNAVECIAAELDLAGDLGGEKDAALIQAAASSKYLFENKKISKERYQQRQAELLSALGWRFRIQECFYLVMEGLANKDLVDFDLAPKYPMYRGVKEDLRVPVIVKILESFEIVQECCHPDPGHMEGRFDSAVYWLATVIVRSSTNLRRTMSFLIMIGLLGKVDLEYLNSIELEEVEDVDFSEPLHPPIMEESLLPQTGFWLPQSSDKSVESRTWAALGRYNRIKTSFEQFFGEGSWGIDDLIQNSLMFLATSYYSREECGSK
ncbi:hypothetical protein JMJ35_005880 [Cladonia borealis]|uniref:Uncharacterized protein n=1 Tax=Cladonia borealis TaxID=184061 RepID=A0AA39QY00_9LECA|nr:hypothetical protein JMJ35_005880 [Cladonia borealis]